MHVARAIFSGILSFVLVVTLVTLGIVITVNLTILNPNFIISELDKLDIYSIIADQMREQIPAEEPYIAQVVDETIADLEPWLKEQTATVIYGGCAYLKGDQELNIVIPLDQVRASIKNNLGQAILESPPPELAGFSQSQIQVFLSPIYAEIDSQIPQQIEINETALGPEITTQLQQARQIVSYIELGYKALIGLAALLILLIALIQWWQVKPISRYVGIPLTTAGVFSLVGTIAARSLIPNIIPSEVPPEIVSTLSPLITDFTSPLQTYGIALLIAGIGLIVLSIKLKSPGYAS
jgi:hypothetical protein